MDLGFWAQRWRADQIGFHLRHVNPHLVRHAARLPAGPVLVPLCGKSLDLEWLARQGREVVGVEFVETAARAFFAERGLSPERTAGPPLTLAHGPIRIVVADFFTASLGRFPAVFDRAALIAVDPARRSEYLDRLVAAVADDGVLLLVTLDHDMGGGPPFSVPAAEFADLASGRFTLELLDDVDALVAEPRFRERGATRMREQVWLGRPATGPAG